MNTRRELLVVYCATLTMTTAMAAEYPERPIRLIVPFPPGGGTDILARMVANGLTEANDWFIVDTRPGAGGNIGSELGARTAPDGPLNA